ncbi:MAG: asparagine synthase [bacterium]|nr:MAG: asparagine synthase [bacterium]KAF0149801.1 MAG: asparagine synthase [bacterium]KAF0168502.1 MAG: asparagine synthase [bacterium]TXT19565.1 MAG: asparagine synthase [bacterium]
MHRLAGWLGHDTADAAEILEQMLAPCSVARPAHTQADPHWGLAGNLAPAVEGPVAALITGRPRFEDSALQKLAPAAALLALWKKHGRDAPKHIHGNFALAVLDRHEQSVFLALDRIGAEKLAFAPGPAGIVFASQADMVAAHPAVGRRLDHQGLFNYLYFHQVPAPGSIFSGVEKLLPAQWAYWRKGKITRGFYWVLAYRDEPRDDFDTQAVRFHRLLRECVGRAKGGDEVASFLSGGTDSSTVSGVLKELAGQASTYSIGFDANGFDEMEYARVAARRFGLDMREYYLKPEDIVSAIPVIATHYDEPFANDSAVPTYFCARLAAEDGHRFMLAGDGGDEIFGGNERYAKQKVFEAYHLLPELVRKGLIEPLAGLPGLGALPPVRKARSYIRQANIPLPERMESYNFVYRQPLTGMFTPDLLSGVDAHQPSDLLKEVYDRADSDSFVNRLLHLDLKFTLADNDLRKVAGMTEAAGIEVRYPLLDDALVDFSGEVPPDWKVKGRYLRWFFKKALVGFLPDEIINKSKHGFGLPFGVWAREYTPLRERVEDRLADLKKRDILQPAYIDHVRGEHMTGHATYFGKMIWVMTTLEEWLQAERL